MAIELKIILKDSERTLSKEWLIYEIVSMSPKDETIQRCLKEIRDEFKGEPEDIKVKSIMVIQ